MDMPRLGTRKLYYLLKSDFESASIKLGRDHLFTFLRKKQMLVKPKKNYTKTTHSKHWLRKHPNLYYQKVCDHPEQFFVSDITYVKSHQRTHYLSLVTDAFSRKIMGYHLSDDMTSESVVKALQMAAKNKKTAKRTIHHSDRGLQYCSSLYQKELLKNKMIPSMTDGYDCYQNALAERINGILKQEYLIVKTKNKKDLNQLIKHAVDSYNNRRPHESLNYKTPNYIHQKTEVENLLRSI
jgi:putative transposase